MDFTQLGTDIGNAINTITDIKDAILGIPDDIRNIGDVSNNISVDTGDVITNSGIYVEMNFVLNLMGKDYDMPIKQYVDITSS